MFDLSDYIKSKRDTLSPSSLKTYTSILSSLYRKVFDDKEIDPKNYDDTEKLLSFLKVLPANKSKTILSALVVITNDKKNIAKLCLETSRLTHTM